MERFRIGVVAAREMHPHRRLLHALQQLFPVVFEGRQTGELGDLDGVLMLGANRPDQLPRGVRALVTAAPGPVPAPAPAPAPVEFAADQDLARALRGRRLMQDSGSRDRELPHSERDATLASVAGHPVWWRRADGGAYLSAFAVEELREGEPLREQLRTGRFMGLVPLLHLLRDVCEGCSWSEEPLRASFVIDDPNLHWTSYGFLDYARLIRHAARHRYHVGLAMVPLDGWIVNARAASLVRENPRSLSLLVHGNDHVARELGRLSGDSDAEAAVAQALRRVASFERRSGVPVGRVMAPPHGACSEAALRAMFRLGFNAACISRPHPWREPLPALSPLAGWHPAELVAGGLPVLPRHHLDGERDELVFRALLRQPLILYGHHWDFADGLGVLAQAAADINGLGDVRWGPLEEIAANNYATRREGDILAVEMYSRRALLDVPEGVTGVRVQTREVYGEPLWRGLAWGTGSVPMSKCASGWASGPLEVRPPARVELSFPADRPLRAAALAEPPVKPWPMTRRVLVEGRDRVRPLLGGRTRASSFGSALNR